jgi:hypothetical protein
MEFLLLWVDDLDDGIGALRHLAPKILGFLFAVALFIGTALAFSRAPQFTAGIVAIMLSAGLVEAARRRRIGIPDKQ